jgi:hypothetical protein
VDISVAFLLIAPTHLVLAILQRCLLTTSSLLVPRKLRKTQRPLNRLTRKRLASHNTHRISISFRRTMRTACLITSAVDIRPDFRHRRSKATLPACRSVHRDLAVLRHTSTVASRLRLVHSHPRPVTCLLASLNI